MRRLFCYTLSARAIGATVSAGALHAQGWGFESLIAHHLIEKAPSDGGLSFLCPVQRDSNPQGCGAEETRSVFQRSTQGAKRRSGSGRRSRTRHPSSPTIELETVLERGPFLFGPVAEGFEPAGCAPFQGQWSKNAKYEYCYLFGNSIFEVSEGKFDIKAADNGPDEHFSANETGHMWPNSSNCV